MDQAITGSGVIDFGGPQNVDHVTVHVTTFGGLCRFPDDGVTDHVLRAGWISLGYELTEGGQDTAIYWLPPWHIAFEHTLIPLELNVTYPVTAFRWFLSPGTTAYVFAP